MTWNSGIVGEPLGLRWNGWRQEQGSLESSSLSFLQEGNEGGCCECAASEDWKWKYNYSNFIYAYKEIQCIENGLESSFHKTGFFSYLLECDAQMIQ